jgi:hypothetical protein
MRDIMPGRLWFKPAPRQVEPHPPLSLFRMSRTHTHRLPVSSPGVEAGEEGRARMRGFECELS